MEFPISPSEKRAAARCAGQWPGPAAHLARLLADIEAASAHLDAATRYGEGGDIKMHAEVAAARALLAGVLA